MAIGRVAAGAFMNIGRRILANPKAVKAIAGLGVAAISSAAAYVGVDLTGANTDEDRLRRIFDAVGNPQTLEAVITKMLAEATPSAGMAALNQLEEMASTSENPEIALAIVQGARMRYERALNTGDGSVASAAGGKLGDYLKGYEYIATQENILKTAKAMLGLTSSGLATLRAAILMDEDVFQKVITRV